jgi:hypothetical protein
MSEAPVSKSKTVLDHVAAMAFRKRPRYTENAVPDSVTSLEDERQNLQEEISKLTMIISDESIALTDAEIIDINDEINALISDKHFIEKDILRLSRGQINYVNPKAAGHKVYFGRAKDVQNRQIQEEEEAKRLRRVSPESIKEIQSKEECVQETILKSQTAPISSKPKRTRFDEDED